MNNLLRVTNAAYEGSMHVIMLPSLPSPFSFSRLFSFSKYKRCFETPLNATTECFLQKEIK